ncbi:hypothetical protein PENTCL1PPCAC_23286 [Pristionchus entomophagus]|uniref:G protein-coupled receptor n=1 Tax=Pristionchus entomophagus TaxID=358040 RepID=A0AAV5U3P7_9BILA|nr:hypothetical protein PENTCL1PPCAC_23286 [Pristionchus entomophagus]
MISSFHSNISTMPFISIMPSVPMQLACTIPIRRISDSLPPSTKPVHWVVSSLIDGKECVRWLSCVPMVTTTQSSLLQGRQQICRPF